MSLSSMKIQATPFQGLKILGNKKAYFNCIQKQG